MGFVLGLKSDSGGVGRWAVACPIQRDRPEGQASLLVRRGRAAITAADIGLSRRPGIGTIDLLFARPADPVAASKNMPPTFTGR
jgi:hypothetical protein